MSPYRKGEKITIDEYYRYIFENVKGLPKKAKEENMNALEYMQKYGVFEIESLVYELHKKPLSAEQMKGATTDKKTGVITKDGVWKMSTILGIKPHESSDKYLKRIFWSDGGVHQNITFPVHSDPISGMHCWHQKVRIEVAHPDNKYDDIEVDTNKLHEEYKKWLSLTRPAPEPSGERRPLHYPRALKPDILTYYVDDNLRD